MNLTERVQTLVTQKPIIVKNNEYVIIGSTNHGHQIQIDAIMELINSLRDVVALKMEGDNVAFDSYHPMSTEVLTKASVGNVPFSYISETNGKQDRGSLLLRYGVPEEIIELFPLCMLNAYNGGLPDDFSTIIQFLEKYKEDRFNFMDVKRSMWRFQKVVDHWVKNDLNLNDLNEFTYDFDKFTGCMREQEFWKPDLKSLRKSYDGKIAVCVGGFHVSFIKSVLDGEETECPKWNDRFKKYRKDNFHPQSEEYLQKIYDNIHNALR